MTICVLFIYLARTDTNNYRVDNKNYRVEYNKQRYFVYWIC